MTETLNKDRHVEYNRAKLWQIFFFAMNNTSTNIYLLGFTFITYLSTGILGLAAIFVSQLMGYIRIFDGFIDPAIGVIIDKTETKFGKFRPILIIGNMITALSFVFLLNLDTFGQGARIPLFMLALIVHKIGYSLQQTITKAGQTALTNDPSQRPVFNIIDGVMTTALFSLGQVVISGTLIPKYRGFTAEFFDALYYGIIIISAVLALMAVIGIWEKDNEQYFGLGEKTKKTPIKEYWQVLKGNKPLQVLSVSAALVKFVVQTFNDSVVMVMMFGILFGNYALSGTISLLMIIPGALVNIAASAIARRKGLRYAYIKALQTGVLGLILLMGLLFIGKPGSLDFKALNLYTIAFVIFYIFGRYASGAPASLVLTMGADISDYETSESGRYVSGMIGTIFSLTDSVASSFAPMVVGAIVAMVGFSKEFPTAETPLTPDLKMAIIAIFTIIPLIALLVSLFMMRFYKLDDRTMIEIQEKIHVMKAAKDQERALDIAENVDLSDMDYVDINQYPVNK